MASTRQPTLGRDECARNAAVESHDNAVVEYRA
jgi:hypothetical protein